MKWITMDYYKMGSYNTLKYEVGKEVVSFFSISDSDGRLLPASTHSSAHAGGQSCVHGASYCHEGAQLFSQPQTACTHPRGAHHSQFTLQNTLQNIR